MLWEVPRHTWVPAARRAAHGIDDGVTSARGGWWFGVLGGAQSLERPRHATSLEEDNDDAATTARAIAM